MSKLNNNLMMQRMLDMEDGLTTSTSIPGFCLDNGCVVEELKGLTKDLDNKWKSEQSKESLEFLRRMEKDHSRKFPTVEYITMTNDDRILTSCVKFSSTKNTNRKSVDISIEPIQLEKKLVLLTGDRNLRVKAISKQVPVRTISEFCSWVEFKPKKL
uniref:PIN domain-containing protein n=1 Tax=Romanomermis culicivorax TaxID=13658 RepID=A0A915K3Q2_ROMCU